MKLFRLRFILLGLLLCICHVWCSTCGREFGDAASNAYYAQIVVIGTVSQQLPPDVKNTYDSIVRVKTSRDILKGSKILKTNFKFRRGFSITVGKFGEEDVINCVSPVKRDQKYLFFLNVTNSVKYYTQTGLPIHAKSKRDFKKSKKLVTRMLCNKGDCVKSPVWDNKRKMKDKTIEIGKSIELNCKLKRSSFPSALYKWYKNDTEVQSLNISGLTIKDSKKGSRLKIKKASPADAGTYKCIAANIGGSIQQEAVINISGVAGPSNPSREMRDKSQKYNGTLKLTCRTKSGVKPKPIFLWYKDGKEIQTGSRKGLTIKTRGSESKLRKKNVVHSDEGTYKCVAKNAGGMATQTSKVKVVGGPNRTIPCGKEGDGYCFNGGTCRIMLEFRKNTTYCVCPKNYRGKRCDSFTYPGRKIREEQKLAQDRHLIIVGIISGILLFIGICVLSYFLAKRRREQFYRRRRQNMNGNIEDNIPQVYRPLIGCDEIDGLKKHMNGVVIHKVGSDETQTIETCFLGNDKGSLYINPLEGYIQGNDKNSRNRKPAISIEEDPSPEPATPEDSCEFPNENSSVTPKNKNSGSNSASDGAPNERLNDLSPRRQSQGREHSKPGAINGVPNIQGSDPTKPPAFNLDTDSEDDILSDGTPLTPLHISEEEDNNERNKTNNKQGSTSTMDRVEEKNRKNSNTKECNESKPIEPSELFPMIKKKDKPPPPPPQQQPQNEKLYASSSSSSSDGGESDSSSTTEGCDSPNTLANLHEELGSDPVLHQVMIQNNYNPEANPPGPVHGPENKGPAPEARQPKPQGTRGPSTRPTGQRGPGGPRDHGPRGHHHHHHRDPRGPPRDHREHGPRVPGPRDPRDPREMRDPRDMRDPNHPRDPRDPRGPPRDPRDPRDPRHQGFRPAPLRDPRDHRPDQGPRSGPRDPGARGPPGPRDPSNRPMPPRDIGPTRDPNHKNAAPQPPAPDSRGPEPQPQQNIPPFPVFSNFYDTPPVDNRNQRLKTVGRNQGPISL